MSHTCDSFRAELERRLAGGGRGLGALTAEPHARECAACRIALARELALERALEALPPPETPPALARRTLAALAHARAPAPALEDRELDELLAHLPAPRVPPALGERVLAGLAPARAPRPRRARLALLAAAAVVLLAALWSWRQRQASAPLPPPTVEAEDLESDEDLLAYACERWEELNDEDLDLWLASLDPLDRLLLEYAGEEWPEPEAAAPGGGGGF